MRIFWNCYSDLQYFQIDLGGPYHAGLDPYHDLDIPRHVPRPGVQQTQDKCGAEDDEGGAVMDMWVPYTAIIILFAVLLQVCTGDWIQLFNSNSLILLFIQSSA